MDKEIKVSHQMETWIALALAAIVLVLMSGCAVLGEGEMYIGKRRIDSYETTQRQTAQPLKCLFTECGGVEK